MGELTTVLVGLGGGIVGLLLGGLAGAAISRVTLWKGPAIVGAGMAGQMLVSLLVALAGYEEPFLVGWVLFVLFAGLTARLLGLGARVSSVIIIGGVLGFLLAGLLIIFGIVHFVQGAGAT